VEDGDPRRDQCPRDAATPRLRGDGLARQHRRAAPRRGVLEAGRRGGSEPQPVDHHAADGGHGAEHAGAADAALPLLLAEAGAQAGAADAAFLPAEGGGRRAAAGGEGKARKGEQGGAAADHAASSAVGGGADGRVPVALRWPRPRAAGGHSVKSAMTTDGQ
jgi:hypothetical protein